MRKPFAACLLALLLVGSFPLSAIAGTTGALFGRVTDSSSHAPLAGVNVTASSPSGAYKTTTDARGYYALAGVVPDTYVLSLKRDGYGPVSIPGIIVFADDIVTENVPLSTSLKEIAQTTSHSRGGAYQPSQTSTTYSVNAQQINDLQGNVLNDDGRSLLKQLPGVTLTQGGPNLENTPIIRGGRANAVSFEFEGIPVQDARTNSSTFMLNLPGFAVSEMQESPGTGDASSFSGGSGTINELTRRGTYPGFFDLSTGVGGGEYNHSLAFDWGTGTKNGRWSQYFAFMGVNTNPIYGGNEYPSTEIGVDADISEQWSREVVENLIYRWGTNNKYALQLLTNNLSNENIYAYGNTQGYCFESCDPMTALQIGSYTGLGPDQLAPIIGLYPGQRSLDQTFGTDTPPVAITSNSNQVKLEFDDQLSASALMQVRLFRTNALETINQAATYQPSGAVYLKSGGPTTGASIDFTKQLNEQNMLKAGGYLNYASPIEDADSYNGSYVSLLGLNDGNAMIYDFVPNGPNCPAFLQGSCGYLYNYFPGTQQLSIPPLTTQTYLSTHQYAYYITDRYSPNDRLHADIGFRMDRRHYDYPTPGVDPATCTTLYVPATWNVPATGAIPGVSCPTATFNLDRGETDPAFIEPRLGLSYLIDNNDAVRVSYGRSVSFPQINAIDNNNLNQNYGAQFNKVPAYWNSSVVCMLTQSPTYCGLPPGTDLGSALSGGAFSGPTSVCGIPGYNVPCANYGEELRWTMAQGFSAIPIQPLHTATYSNYDMALQHQFTKGALEGIGVSLDLWGRRGADLTTSTQLPLLGANGQVLYGAGGAVLYQPAATHDVAVDLANGEELRITKIVPYGLSAQLGLTWEHVMTNVPPTGDPGFFGVFLPSESGAYGGTTPPASLNLGLLYPISYSPRFATSLDLSYKTHNGWRLATQIYGNTGYPLGAGNYTALAVNGVSMLVPNTNYSTVAAGSGTNNTSQYVDPLNPGTVLNPVISATRGTAEGQLAGEVFSHPDVRMNATLEKELTSKFTVGLTVNNIFNESYVVPGLNNLYQPVANGVSGPLSGQDPYAGIASPAHFTYLPQFGGNQPYTSFPYGIGRTYYVYFTAKNL